MRWRYGDAGDRYPIQPGDIWQVGPHWLACGDLEVGAIGALLAHVGEAPHHAYCDPPWNAGNARAFRVKAGVDRKVDFPRFIAALLDAFSAVGGHIFIEMGRQHVDGLAGWISAAHGRVLACWPITYYRRKPCWLVHCTWSNVQPLVARADGLDDEETPYWALSQVAAPGEWILDPVIGRGLTAIAADRLGCRVIGLELHPRRLAVTVDKLVQRGHTARWAGKL